MHSTSKYVELKGIRTWYDEHGAGEPLVLFHPGGIGVDSRVFHPNLEELTSCFRVFLPERRGHGHTPDADGPYTYELMAQDMIDFLDHVVGRPARLLGVSDGGVVALLVTLRRPDLVTRLVCVASVFHRNGWLDAVRSQSGDPPDVLVASYEAVSPDGKSHHAAVKKKLDQMHLSGPTLTTDDLNKIDCRTLVIIGDDDEVTLEHAVEFYRALPHGELAIVPGTSHGVLVEKPDLCNKIMVDFLTLDPVPTFAPRRRA